MSGAPRLLLGVAVATGTAVFGAALTVVVWYAGAVRDEAGFVPVAAEVLASEPARRLVAEEVVDRIVRFEPAVAVVRGPAESTIAAVLASPVFAPLAEEAARSLHGALLVGGPVVVDLGPWRDELLAPLAALAPAVAEAVPSELFGPFVLVDAGRLPRLPDPTPWGIAAAIGAFGTFVLLLVLLRRAAAVGLVAFGVGLGLAGTLVVAGAAGLPDRAGAGLVDPGHRLLAATLAERLAAPLTVTGVVEASVGVGSVLASAVVIRRRSAPS